MAWSLRCTPRTLSGWINRYLLGRRRSAPVALRLAWGSFQRGDRRDGGQSKAHAREAIGTVRRFVGAADLSRVVTASFASRCDELKGVVAALTDGCQSRSVSRQRSRRTRQGAGAAVTRSRFSRRSANLSPSAPRAGGLVLCLEFDSLGSTAFPTCEYRAIESA